MDEQPGQPPTSQPVGPARQPVPPVPAQVQPVAGSYATGPTLPDAEPAPSDISWSAAEFVEHQKSASWYMLLALAALVVAAVDFFFVHDIISTIAIILAAAMFGVYAGHKPRTQQYSLSSQGLQIGERFYAFQAFKNFSVTDEGSVVSVVFMPLKRFAPPLTIYLMPNLEDQVLDYLSDFLPFEQHRSDAVDGLLRRIKF